MTYGKLTGTIPTGSPANLENSCISMMAENRTDRNSFIGTMESQLDAFFSAEVGYVVLGSSERAITTNMES